MKIKFITICAILSLLLSGCGAYVASSGGKSDVGFIVVLKENNRMTFENLEVIVDNQSFNVNKAFDQNKPLKALKLHRITTTPGMHNVKVLQDGKTIYEDKMLIGLQETSKIILR